LKESNIFKVGQFYKLYIFKSFTILQVSQFYKSHNFTSLTILQVSQFYELNHRAIACSCFLTNVHETPEMGGPEELVQAAHVGAAGALEVVRLGQQHQLVALAVDAADRGSMLFF
jgi:hypothetical protein